MISSSLSGNHNVYTLIDLPNIEIFTQKNMHTYNDVSVLNMYAYCTVKNS